MQPVNVLPSFVSQDADLNTKDSSKKSAKENIEADFSRLVEQHVSDNNKTTSDNSAQAITDQNNEQSAAKQSHIIAANGNDEVNQHTSRQESDSCSATEKNNSSQENTANSATIDVSATLSSADATNNAGATGLDALAESEQFISLLYNSDQALTNAADKSKQLGELSHLPGKQATIAAGEAQTQSSDANVASKKTTAPAFGNGQANQQSGSDMITEHKLKAFSKAELLARAELKNNALAAQPSEQGLKSEQLTHALLKNNKVTDLAASVAPATKSQLTEQVDSGLYQLPVEPIGEGDLTDGGLLAAIKEPTAKAGAKQSEGKASESVKTPVELTSQLAAAVAEKTDNSSIKDVMNKANITEPKIAAKTATATSLLDQVNSDKLNSAKLSSDGLSSEKLLSTKNSTVRELNEKALQGSKEQGVAAQAQQPSITRAQIQNLSQSKAQQAQAQSAQIISSELQANDTTADEYAYTDSMLLSQEKPIEQAIQATSKGTDSIAVRSASELQAQTVQMTQTKQSNDAYVDYQAAEVLNHNIVSDSVQIQKNNVQLHQETIAIFRKDFADAVKDKVMIMINQKLQQFDITLDPPEFGNMQVRVNLQGEQATVNFVVQNQQAKDALEQNMHKLRDMLAEQGVDVGDANVEQQSQQQNNDDDTLKQDAASRTILSGQAEEDHQAKQLLSAQLFDSSVTGVDYYA